MILTGDYHTHTKYSHGKGTVLDNAVRAKEIGLKEIAISDHGFAHPAFGLRKGKVPKLKADCKKATEITGVKVLVGIESNIISLNGDADLKEKFYDDFDTFFAGVHKFVLFTPSALFKFFIPNQTDNLFKIKQSKRLIRETTKMYVNLIKKRPVDCITHLNYCCQADAVEVAKAAADYGTYIELNSKKVHLTDEELVKILDTGVRFLVDSDAHSIDRIGDTKLVEEQLKRVNFDYNRIDNIDGRTPNFRFRAFKEGK